MAKWPNHFISGKQFQKRPNWADLAFKKAKWQPCLLYLPVITMSRLGLCHTRHFCAQYCDKNILQTFFDLQYLITLTHGYH